METNLKTGRVPLITVANELRPETRRMVEYLNREMQNAEILGLELKYYGNDNASMVLVPQVVEQTQGSIDRRVSNSDAEIASGRNLNFKITELSEERLAKFLDILLKYCRLN